MIGLRLFALQVRALTPSCGTVRVVAVDGPSAAGKSTFADRLAEALGGAPVVRSDEFPVPWEGDPLTWWAPFEEQVLKPFSEGRAARYRPYDWRTDSYGEQVEIAVPEVLIVDGVGAAHERAPVSYRIWVDAPREVRRQRVIGRDGAEIADVWERWSENERAHFAKDGTRARADLCVDGGSTNL